MKNQFIPFLVVLISSCHFFESPKDGGPCSYKTDVLPAQVIDLYAIDSNYYEAVFEVKLNDQKLKDTLYYSNEFSGYLDKQMLIKSQLQIGKKYTYEIKEIIDGHCNPRIERLRLNPFIQ